MVEGANGPTTAVADEILADKRIFIVPDILANAGGVTASYFEWVQDRQGYFWKEAIVNEQLEQILRDSFDDVVRYRRGPQREQPHRGLHAGHRSRGVHHQAARDLRVASAFVYSGNERVALAARFVCVVEKIFQSVGSSKSRVADKIADQNRQIVVLRLRPTLHCGYQMIDGLGG